MSQIPNGKLEPTTMGEIEAFVQKHSAVVEDLKGYRYEATIGFVDTISVLMLKKLILDEIDRRRAEQNTTNFSEKEGHIRHFRDILAQLENYKRVTKSK
ncbi:hypothetical protein CMI37_34960 [Candidatus Pacearchaeota archaeon]|nr:hypothetical protein [Candidatus Pacearchaeota archaeon]